MDTTLNLKLIRNFLKLNNLNLREFCEKYGLNHDYVDNFFIDNKNFDLQTIIKVAQILDLEVNELFTD